MKILKYTAYTIGATLFALSAACVLYKPPPDVIHSDNYTAENSVTQQSLPAINHELTVTQAMMIALANNPTYKQAELAVIQSWATYYGSLNAFTPQVVFNGPGVYQSGVYGQGGSPYSNTFANNNAALGLQGTWNVFNGLQDVMAAMAAMQTAKSVEEQEKLARMTLINTVKTDYYNVLSDKANIIIDETNMAYWQELVRETQLKYDAGATNLGDLLNQKISYNGARVSLVTHKASYANDKYALAVAMGLTTANIPEEIKFPSISVLDDKGYTLGVEFYLDLAINQRPDIQQYRDLLKAAKYNLYGSWGAFSPTATAIWNYQATSSSTTTAGTNYNIHDEMFGNSQWTNNYGIYTSWTLWDGNQRSSRIATVRSNQAAYDSAQEGVMNNWLTVVQNVRTAYTNLTRDIANKEIDKQTMEYARQRRDLVTDQYNAGNIDVATLNQAQQQYVTPEQWYVNAVIQIATDRSNLDLATGLKD